MVFKARDIVIDLRVVTYVELRYIEYFNTNKFQKFKILSHTLCDFMVIFIPLKNLPIFLMVEANLFGDFKTIVLKKNAHTTVVIGKIIEYFNGVLSLLIFLN